MKSKLYPSQKRYRRENPTIAFQLRREEKRELQKIAKERKISLSKLTSSIVREWLKGAFKEKEDLKTQIEELKREKESLELSFKEYKAKEKERGEELYKSIKERIKKELTE